jgi:hypothetical protein
VTAKEQTTMSHQIKATNLTREDAEFIAAHASELSDSTKRAKWIHSPDERADRPGQTLATRSLGDIEHWADIA